MSNGEVWTEDEDIYLEFFIFENDTQLAEAATFLNRSVGAVYTRLDTLRKRGELDFYANKKWSENEKTFVKKNYMNLSVENMGQRLGRTEAAVAYQMRKLGLRKAKSIGLYDAKIREMAKNGYYSRQASRELGINNSSLQNYCNKNGIEFRKATGEETTAELRKTIKRDYFKYNIVRKKVRS